MRGLEVGGQLTEFMTKSSKVILFIYFIKFGQTNKGKMHRNWVSNYYTPMTMNLVHIVTEHQIQIKTMNDYKIYKCIKVYSMVSIL